MNYWWNMLWQRLLTNPLYRVQQPRRAFLPNGGFFNIKKGKFARKLQWDITILLHCVCMAWCWRTCTASLWDWRHFCWWFWESRSARYPRRLHRDSLVGRSCRRGAWGDKGYRHHLNPYLEVSRRNGTKPKIQNRYLSLNSSNTRTPSDQRSAETLWPLFKRISGAV